jgi:hypothetical protein
VRSAALKNNQLAIGGAWRPAEGAPSSEEPGPAQSRPLIHQGKRVQTPGHGNSRAAGGPVLRRVRGAAQKNVLKRLAGTGQTIDFIDRRTPWSAPE